MSFQMSQNKRWGIAYVITMLLAPAALHAAEPTALRQDMLKAVNELPSRNLADVAAQAIKDAVVQDLRSELIDLRREVAALHEQLEQQRRNADSQH